jgi:hypothetical protein
MQPELTLPGDHLPHGAASVDDDEADFERSRGLIDSVIKPLIAIDFQGRILDITPVAAMLLKGQVNKFKGGTIESIFPELAGDVSKVAMPGLTTFARRADGTPMPVRLNVMRVCTEYLEGWVIFLQVRKAPSLQEGLSQMTGPVRTNFNLP